MTTEDMASTTTWHRRRAGVGRRVCPCLTFEVRHRSSGEEVVVLSAHHVSSSRAGQCRHVLSALRMPPPPATSLRSINSDNRKPQRCGMLPRHCVLSAHHCHCHVRCRRLCHCHQASERGSTMPPCPLRSPNAATACHRRLLLNNITT